MWTKEQRDLAQEEYDKKTGFKRIIYLDPWGRETPCNSMDELHELRVKYFRRDGLQASKTTFKRGLWSMLWSIRHFRDFIVGP